jgi:hypothetical protein
MIFHNISKVSKELIWVDHVKNVGLDEVVYIIDDEYEGTGKTISISKTKTTIRPDLNYNFSNHTKVLFTGENDRFFIPTNIFGSVFDADFNPLDNKEKTLSLNHINFLPSKINPLFLTKPNEFLFDNEVQIINGSINHLDAIQLDNFMKKVDTRNKIFVFCKLLVDSNLNLNDNHTLDFGDPILFLANGNDDRVINCLGYSFSMAEHLILKHITNTILIVEGVDKYIQEKLKENSKLCELATNYSKLDRNQIEQSLKRNFFLKNEKVGLTIILV